MIFENRVPNNTKKLKHFLLYINHSIFTTNHFLRTILSHFVPVWAAINFFKSPMVSSELDVWLRKEFCIQRPSIPSRITFCSCTLHYVMDQNWWFLWLSLKLSLLKGYLHFTLTFFPSLSLHVTSNIVWMWSNLTYKIKTL
jgi:hypothetical protein